MSNYTLITIDGLTAASEATSNGTLIDIRYFVPIYDYRIDRFIDPVDTSFSASEITSIATSADTYASGEQIWNSTGTPYSLSDDSNIMVSAYGGKSTVGTLTTYTDCKHRKSQSINLYNGNPIWNTVSGTEVVPPSGTSTYWGVNNATEIEGINSIYTDPSTIPLENFHNTVEYSSIQDSNNIPAASFMCRINKNIGSYKFNKIALYCVKLDQNYDIVGSPVLFAITNLNETQVKTSLQEGGLDEIIVDVQVKLNTSYVDFTNILVGTSGDYWQRMPEGQLLYHDQVVVSNSFNDSVDSSAAKMLVATQHTYGNGISATKERTMPQLGLQYYDNSDSDTGNWIKYTNYLSTTSGGDLEIGSDEQFGFERYITPKTSATYSFGKSFDTSYKKLFLTSHLYLGNYTDEDDGSIMFDTTFGCYFRNVNIYTFRKNIEIKDAYASSIPATFIGDLRKRYNQQMVIFTEGSDPEEYGNSDIYIIPGTTYSFSLTAASATEGLADLYLEANDIYIGGSMIPRHYNISIGDYERGYEGLHINRLTNGTVDYHGVIDCECDLVPYKSTAKNYLGYSYKPWHYLFSDNATITNASITNITNLESINGNTFAWRKLNVSNIKTLQYQSNTFYVRRWPEIGVVAGGSTNAWQNSGGRIIQILRHPYWWYDGKMLMFKFIITGKIRNTSTTTTKPAVILNLTDIDQDFGIAFGGADLLMRVEIKGIGAGANSLGDLYFNQVVNCVFDIGAVSQIESHRYIGLQNCHTLVGSKNEIRDMSIPASVSTVDPNENIEASDYVNMLMVTQIYLGDSLLYDMSGLITVLNKYNSNTKPYTSVIHDSVDDQWELLKKFFFTSTGLTDMEASTKQNYLNNVDSPLNSTASYLKIANFWSNLSVSNFGPTSNKYEDIGFDIYVSDDIYGNVNRYNSSSGDPDNYYMNFVYKSSFESKLNDMHGKIIELSDTMHIKIKNTISYGGVSYTDPRWKWTGTDIKIGDDLKLTVIFPYIYCQWLETAEDIVVSLGHMSWGEDFTGPAVDVSTNGWAQLGGYSTGLYYKKM